MAWPFRVGRNAGLPFVFGTLALGIVVSCVSVSTGDPGAASGTRQTGAATTAVPALAAQATSTPAPGQGAATDPAQAPTPAATALPTPAPTPTAPPTPGPATIASAATPIPAGGAPQAGTRGRGRRSSLNDATRRRLTKILRDMVQRKDIAGLQMAVRLPSGRTWVGTAGNAEFKPPRKIKDDTVFAIASVTKTFIAALILQLAEEGKLSIDELVGAYVPDAPKARTATLRDLLSHTSGIYNYFENPTYTKAAGAWLKHSPSRGLLDREHRWTYDEIMALVEPGYCKTGSCYHYSNTNFVILGKVAEVVGGAPLHKQLRKRFFDPLGMTDTYYQPAEEPPLDAAHGHWDIGSTYTDHTRSSRVIPFMAAITVADAAGAIASTAEDLVTWADALYGGKVLKKRSLREMTTILPQGTYGLGTDVASFAGNRAYGHRGGLRGFEASMWYFPASGVSVALLSNQGNWLTDLAMQRAVKAVLGKG